ncbi:MAG: hypothetical protein NT031_01310 [Planctomycetota bacterium]|nr:hypothetical protein [Planctomycetota bacterium]
MIAPHSTAERRPALATLAWAGLAVLAVLAVTAGTDIHAAPVVQKYINMSVSPTTLDLGSVPGPGAYDSPSELKVHVTANCVHGGVVASVTPLTCADGGDIGRERIFIKLSGMNFRPMTSAVPVTGPMNPGIFDIVLKFRVGTTWADVPGDYAGTLTLTLVPLP